MQKGERVKRSYEVIYNVSFELRFHHLPSNSSDRQHRSIQEQLLSILRKQLASFCLASKALGIVGAVMVLETVCRRPSTSSADLDHVDELHASTQYDDVSGVMRFCKLCEIRPGAIC